MTDTSESYAAQWQEYRRRRRWALGLALAMGPLAVVWLLVEQRPWAEPLAGALSLVWIGVAAVTGWRFVLWPCPRCRRPFCLTSVRHWFWSMSGDRLRALLTAHCVHCGLPKWASSDADASSARGCATCEGPS